MVTQTKQCVHHWIIEPAQARRKSKGRCKKCGEEREFSNSGPQMSEWLSKEEREALDHA